MEFENQSTHDTESGPRLTGDVIFSNPRHILGKGILRRFVHKYLQDALAQQMNGVEWVSYLVTFGNGPEGETRCQIEMSAEGNRQCFSIGYGRQAKAAFRDAFDRIQWVEKDSSYGVTA